MTMPLVAGDRLGPYEIVVAIGAGGMGEVYKARDTRLGRYVAIKVSAEQFGDRFEREARAVAALNHPHICQLYDVGLNYLVMELVEGETLAGPLPLKDAVDYGRQIAEALEAAHEKGIIHRDLKPGNVKITPGGTIKVLDFGLAKALEEEPRPSSTADSPTLTLSATRAGIVLGTAAYMSPEQAKGKPVDRRADIWAFGVVFYEMLTGKQLFTGETAGEILASVIKDQPDLTDIPAAARPLIERCLTRDPRRRLQSIGEARILLEDGLPAPPPVVPQPVRSRFAPISSAIAALAILFSGLLAFLYFRHGSPEPSILEYTVLPPANSRIHSFSISLDGRSLAIVAIAGGKRSLWVRALDSLQAKPLSGTEDAAFPFWSPDSRFVAFTAQDKLKKVSVTAGPPQILVSDIISRQPWPGAWSRDGVILFGALRQVAASGGPASPALGERNVSQYPFFLPGGRFLHTVTIDPDKQGIYVATLGSGQDRRLLTDISNTAYAPPRLGNSIGHVMFVRDGALMAQPVDPDKFKLAGEASPIVEQVAGGLNIGNAHFSVSENGVVVYQKGQETGVGRLAWYERGGSQSGFVGDPGRIFDFALSPDGKRVAIARADQQMKTSDLWIRDIERGTETRLTSNASINERPVWSLDGTWIFFSSTRAGRTDLYHKAANGGAPEEPLFQDKTTRKLAMDLDLGRKLLLFQSQPGIFALPLSGAAKPLAVVTSKFTNSQPQLSTNGRWMAYVSDESGRNEIYVRPFSADGNAPANTWTISNTGGTDPRWQRDGSELFYVSGDAKLMSVHVKTTSGRAFAHDAAQPLFELPPSYARVAPGSFRYSVTGDGKHFLVLTGPKDAVEEPLTVITDWQRLVRR